MPLFFVAILGVIGAFIYLGMFRSSPSLLKVLEVLVGAALLALFPALIAGAVFIPLAISVAYRTKNVMSQSTAVALGAFAGAAATLFVPPLVFVGVVAGGVAAAITAEHFPIGVNINEC